MTTDPPANVNEQFDEISARLFAEEIAALNTWAEKLDKLLTRATTRLGLKFPTDVDATDTGNARLFKMYAGPFCRYDAQSRTWYVWNGVVWEPNDTMVFDWTKYLENVWKHRLVDLATGSEEERYCRKEAMRVQAHAARGNVVRILQTDPDVQISTGALDPDDHIVGAPNGYIDLSTGELLPADSRHMVTRSLSVAYHPPAESELLKEFHETFMPDETDQRVFYGLLGLVLRGGNAARILGILWGPSTSGKSQITKALDRLLGSYARAIGVNVFRGNLDERPRADLADAMHARLVYATEASKGSWEIHADQIKRLTGNDPIPYRNLYEKGMTKAVPKFTPLIIANEMPTIKDADDALRRRLLVIRFDRTIPEGQVDTTKADVFVNDDECLQALLSRIVAAARDPWFQPIVRWDLFPDRYRQYVSDAYAEFDDVKEFIETSMGDGTLTYNPSLSDRQSVRASTLYKAYKFWRKSMDNGKPMGSKNFKKRLLSLGWICVLSEKQDAWKGWQWSGWVPLA